MTLILGRSLAKGSTTAEPFFLSFALSQARGRRAVNEETPVQNGEAWAEADSAEDARRPAEVGEGLHT